MLAPIVT